VSQAETPSDQPAVAKEPADLLRVGVGADVEILRLSAEKQVADAAAYQIGLEARRGEPVQDFQSIRVDALAGDGMLAARADARPDVLGVICCEGKIPDSRVDFVDDRSPCAPAPPILAQPIEGIDLLTLANPLGKNTIFSVWGGRDCR
jgi:hypothetical protein